jgi:hypothetical protein
LVEPLHLAADCGSLSRAGSREQREGRRHGWRAAGAAAAGAASAACRVNRRPAAGLENGAMACQACRVSSVFGVLCSYFLQ